jgi:hypothetical protein
MKIVSVLDEFSKLCDEKGVKFGKFTDEQLLEILHIYRNYRLGDKPPF